MNFKEHIKADLEVFFNTDEFAQEVKYYLGTRSTKVTVQFFDQESELGDSMMRKIIFKKEDLPNISKDGSFLIDTIKYGIIDFRPDEENLLMQVILQKAMR